MPGARASREAARLPLFRADVDKLEELLTKPGSNYATVCKRVYEAIASFGDDVNRETYLAAVEHVLRSGAWPLLLRRLSEDLDSVCLELVPARAVEAGLIHGKPQSADGAAAGDTSLAAVRFQDLETPCKLVCACLPRSEDVVSEPAAAGTSSLSRAAGSGRTAGRPVSAAATPPGRLELLSRAARAVVMSHLPRRCARMSAYAADAAAAGLGQISGSSGSGGSSGSSIPAAGAAAAATAAMYEGGAAAVASDAAGAVAPPVVNPRGLVGFVMAMIDAQTKLASFGRALQPLQPTLAEPPPPPARAAAGGAGGSRGKNPGGKAATAAAAAAAGTTTITIGGAAAAADRTRPLSELVELECARSGLLDQVARLVVHSAAAEGRGRLRSEQLSAAAASGSRISSSSSNSRSSSSSSSSRGAAVQLPSRSDPVFCLASALCLSQQAGLAATAAGAENSSSRGGGSSSSSSTSPLPPPPPTAGTWVRTAVLSQVVATLGAAGFGGGRGGVWGLPAELAAGLPLLQAPRGAAAGTSGPALRLQQAPLAAGEVDYLHELPFISLLMSMSVPPPAHGAAPFSSSTSGRAVGQVQAGSGSSGRSSASSSSASPQQQQQQQQREGAGTAPGVGGGGDWAFPLSPRAAAQVLLRVADLSAASLLDHRDRHHHASGSAAAMGVCSSCRPDERSSAVAVAAAPAGPEDDTSSTTASSAAAAAAAVGASHPADAGGGAAAPKGSEGSAGREFHGRAAAVALTNASIPRRPGEGGGGGTGGRGGPRLLLTREGAWQVAPCAVTLARMALSTGSSSGSSSNSGSSRGGGSSGRRRLPLRYWTTAAAVLRACVTDLTAGGCSSGGGGTGSSYSCYPAAMPRHMLLEGFKDFMHQDVTMAVPGLALPPAAPPALAAPLAAGALGALEACLRAAPDAELALEPLAAFVHFSGHTFGSATSWPYFQQLLAFAPPGQAAALITSLGKRLHRILGEVEREDGATAATAAAAALQPLNTDAMWALAVVALLPSPNFNNGLSAGPVGVPSLEAILAAAGPSATVSSNIVFSPSLIPRGPGWRPPWQRQPMRPPGPQSPLPERRARLLLWHALHRLLPAVARCLRLARLQHQPAVLAGPYTQLMFLLFRPVEELARCDGAADTARGGRCMVPELQHQQPAPAARVARGTEAAASAATASAAAASWRQWLLHDVNLIGLLGLGLTLLAALPPRDGHALGVALAVQNMLMLAALAAPDALAAALAPPLPPGSPWRPEHIRGMLQKHTPTMGMAGFPEDMVMGPLPSVEHVREVAAQGGSGAAIRAQVLGGAATRATLAAKSPQTAGDGPWRYPLSPGEAETEAALLAAAAGAAAAGARSAAAAGSQQHGKRREKREQPEMTATAAVNVVLRCCANPRCTTLAGSSEAELPLQVCGGCRAVRYCSAACQKAHWGAGHKEACRLFKAAAAADGA